MRRKEGGWNEVTYNDNSAEFGLFQLVSLNIRWAPAAFRPSVGYNFDWAWHLWDMSSMSAFSISHSHFLIISPSLFAWGPGHLLPVGAARHSDWSRRRPVWTAESSSFCASPGFSHRFMPLLPFSQTLCIWNTLCSRRRVVNKMIRSKHKPYSSSNTRFPERSSLFFAQRGRRTLGIEKQRWKVVREN